MTRARTRLVIFAVLAVAVLLAPRLVTPPAEAVSSRAASDLPGRISDLEREVFALRAEVDQLHGELAAVQGRAVSTTTSVPAPHLRLGPPPALTSETTQPWNEINGYGCRGGLLGDTAR